MRNDINSWAANCIVCQRSNIFLHTKTLVQIIDVPSGRFEHIHMDLIEPFSKSNGNKYISRIIDRFTRWPEGYPVRDISSTTIAHALVENNIPRFGIPLRITVDQSTQFTSKLFSDLTKLIGYHNIHTSSYRPQANGIVERFHRELKTALWSRGLVYLFAHSSIRIKGNRQRRTQILSFWISLYKIERTHSFR